MSIETVTYEYDEDGRVVKQTTMHTDENIRPIVVNVYGPDVDQDELTRVVRGALTRDTLHRRQVNVWTGGTFDLLHPGHVHLLRQCRLAAGAGRVTVAVNSDDFVRRFKAPTVQNLSERLEMVASVRFVDTTQVNFGGEGQRDLIREAQTDLIVVGDDWKDRNYLQQIACTPDWLDKHAIRLVYVPRAFVTSSTDMKDRIRA